MFRSAIAYTIMAVAALPALAQDRKEAAPSASYKVEFRIRDGSDAAGKEGRRYTILIDNSTNSGRGTFHVGERIPVATGSFQPGTGGQGTTPLVNTQYNYVDTGVNIDASLYEQNGRVQLSATIDVSNVVARKPPAGAAPPPNPTVAQTKITVRTLVPLGKPALVASIDDPVSQQKFDVEATVTKLD